MRTLILAALPLAGCVVSDTPRGLDKEQLVAMLQDPDVRQAVIDALGDAYVQPDDLSDVVRQSDITDVVRSEDIADFVDADDLTDVVRSGDLAGYATDEDLNAEIIARSTLTLPADQDDCEPGTYVSGWDATGHATCASPLASVGCAVGVLLGFDGAGTPVCAAALQGDLDAGVVSADLVIAGAIEAMDDVLPISGPVRIEAGGLANRQLGDTALSKGGWTYLIGTAARRGTMVDGTPINGGMPPQIDIELQFDSNGGAPPSLGDADGQGIVLDVRYYVATNTEIEVIRCSFALIRNPGDGRVQVMAESCDTAMSGAGMGVAVLSPATGDTSGRIQLQFTRSITSGNGWQAWQVDYLSAFKADDWAGIIGPDGAPPG